MSLMAGFDVVLEFPNATIVKLIERTLNIGTGDATPPFDLDFGIAHVIVTDLQIDLLHNDTVQLIVVFNNSSITSPSLIAPLDGFFSIVLRIVTDNGGRPILNLPGVQTADIQLSLSPPSQQLVQGSGYSVGLLHLFANGAIQAFVSSQAGLPLLPAAISIVSGVDGSYSASGVQFERVEVHCVPNQDRANQALAFCGILLAANDGKGDFSQRQSTAVPPGSDLCASISPEAFTFGIACPALRDLLLTGPNKSVAQLPAQCGSAADLNNANTYGVTLTSISDSFADGHVDLYASGHYSPQVGIEVSISAHAAITLAANGGNITAVANVDPPSIDVSLEWWVWLIGAITGSTGLIIAGVADAWGDDLAKKVADAFAGAFKNFSASLGFPFVLVDQIAVTKEGLTVSGKLRADSLPAATHRVRQIELSGSTVTISSTDVATGSLHLTKCPAGDYPYIEQRQQQQGTFTILSTLMGYPMTLDWSIGIGSATVPLVGDSGTASIQAEAHYALAPAVTKQVSVSYHVDPQNSLTMHLQNLPDDGNYSVWLMVTATDPLNNVASTSTQVEFEGDHLNIGGSYAADLAACIAALMKRLKEEARKATRRPWRIPGWVPIDHPTPDTLANFIRGVAAIGGPTTNEVLTQLKLAHGADFDRAVSSVQRAPPPSTPARAAQGSGPHAPGWRT